MFSPHLGAEITSLDAVDSMGGGMGENRLTFGAGRVSGLALASVALGLVLAIGIVASSVAQDLGRIRLDVNLTTSLALDLLR